MADKHRKKADEALLLALACGASVDQAARQYGLSVLRPENWARGRVEIH